MSKFLEIGEIVEIMPEAFTAYNVLNNKKNPALEENNSESSGNTWKWVLGLALVAGTAYVIYRINKKRNENSDPRDQS